MYSNIHAFLCVHTLAHSCHFYERLSTKCLAICLALGLGGQWLVHTACEMCWLLYGKILPCQYELQKNFCRLLRLKALTCKAACVVRNYYVIQHTLLCLCSVEESELSLQGNGVSIFFVRKDIMRWGRVSRQQFLWNVNTCLWYHITEDSYLHGHCCDKS
jgi:hypothetical protein